MILQQFHLFVKQNLNFYSFNFLKQQNCLKNFTIELNQTLRATTKNKSHP